MRRETSTGERDESDSNSGHVSVKKKEARSYLNPIALSVVRRSKSDLGGGLRQICCSKKLVFETVSLRNTGWNRLLFRLFSRALRRMAFSALKIPYI